MSDNVSAFASMEYDEKIKRTLPYYEEFYKQIIDVVKNCNWNNPAWLDVGCGTGKMAEIAFQHFQMNRFVFCDSSAEMIAVAKKHFSFPNTEFLVSPVQDLVFDNEFDIVTAIQVNHYLENKERIIAIQKSYNALKKGGALISFENFAPFSKLGKKLYLSRWKSFQIQHGKSSEEAERHIKRYGKDYFPISLLEQIKCFENCGFQAVEILWLSHMQAGFIGIK